MNEYVEEFNALHPNIEVVPVYSGDYDPTMQKKSKLQSGAATPPDVFIVEISRTAYPLSYERRLNPWTNL